MVSLNSLSLEQLLIRHEGIRYKPYLDSVGKLTIGVGRNLIDKWFSPEETELIFATQQASKEEMLDYLYQTGLSQMQILTLLAHDIGEALSAAIYFPWFVRLTKPRQNVIVSMIFNMGLKKVTQFENMIDAIALGDYEKASFEMLNSKWADQVGRRALELSEMMRFG